jgi:hypothetical protein
MKNLLKKVKTGWLKFAHALGVVNTTILLTVFYVVFIGIYAILTRIPIKIIELIKKNPDTYYIPHKKSTDYKYPF